MRTLLTTAIFTGFLCGPALADKIPPCAAPKGVAVYVSVKTLPPLLAKTLQDQFGYLAEPNESFDATDVVMTGHPNRLIFVWNRGNAWLVARERGGIAYNDPIQTFALDNGKAKLVAERSALPNTVCSVAHAMMKEMP
ncbi:MAG: hypothetical protein JO056_01715 [Alphaproteobacteria bacterium]|jgi:hypothetical protein|nr:hypothetical protein [Alphaproteobacteria bacterium]